MDGSFQAGERLAADVSWRALPVPVRRGGGLENRRSFRALLRLEKPQRVFSYNWGAIEWMVANMPRVAPHVHVEDGFGLDEACGQLPRRCWARRVFFAASGASLVVPSRTLQQAGRGWWLPERRITYIPNGVDVPDSLAPRPAGCREPLRLGTVAGLRPEKNLARMLRAFAVLAQCMPAELWVAGDGPELPRLQALASSLGVAQSVRFMGFVAQPLELIRQLDLFVMSSDTEQQPLALLEAMATGVPVLSTRVGDVPHMLPPGAALMPPPDDEAFTHALLDAVGRRAEWPDWASAGHRLVREHYSKQRMLSLWDAVYAGRRHA
jgi:glycosyltransferase involved in cell wall biosynthesis